MPELPEVEVTRRGIADLLHGAKVLAVRLGKPLRWPLGCAPETLVGLQLGEVQRRGKYLWLPVGDAGAGLLMHLGMSGSMSVLTAAPWLAPPAGAHDHFDLQTDRGTLRLNDPRRFGAIVWSAGYASAPAATLLGRLGAEPFDASLTPQSFHAALRGRRAPIKSVLLAGDVVVGAGNIYACEALFAAGIHPLLRAERLSRPRAAKLLAALRLILGRALELGGSTLRDFSDAHGVSGAYQTEAAVYGRAGLPCRGCGGAVKRIVQAQRSSYFCPRCQRR